MANHVYAVSYESESQYELVGVYSNLALAGRAVVQDIQWIIGSEARITGTSYFWNSKTALVELVNDDITGRYVIQRTDLDGYYN